MSVVREKELTLPEGVTVSINGTSVEVNGKNGSLKKEFSPLITISVNGSEVTTERANEEKHTKQLHGTTNSLLQGMIEGVSEGFKKEIEIKGVGYKAAIKGDKLVVNAGYSHPVEVKLLDGVKVETPSATEVVITGSDKQIVGQMAALIRDIRRPNPYSGKGIMYKGEHIRRKEGKAASK